MVFKRRKKRPVQQVVVETLYPRGGWSRAAQYIKHRLQRLPDPPHRIARGIFAGVFTTFTPFYSVHFFIAAGIALALRGNVLAALLATFFGNPLTYIPIAVVSLKTGHFLLGTEFDPEINKSLLRNFADAAHDLYANFLAAFTEAEADWTNLRIFYDEVFFPYMIGGIIPGLIAGITAYYIALPVITAYKKARRGRLKKKLEILRSQAKARADGAGESL